MRSNIVIVAGTCALVGLLTACGGGGGGGGGSATTKLAFPGQDVSDDRSVAREIGPEVSAASISRSTTRAVSSGGGERSRLVSESITGDIKSVFPIDLDVTEFAVPVEIRDGTSYLSAVGDFQVNDASGKPVDCTVMISNLRGGEPAECLYTVSPLESAEVKTAVIREGNYEGEAEENDVVYWTVNNNGGGFRINKFDGNSISTVFESETGKITDLLYGEHAIFAYDATGETDQIVFGNEFNGILARQGTEEYLIDRPDRPVLYKNFVIYPVRNTEVGVRSGVFLMGQSAIGSYGGNNSINCGGPATRDMSASHSYGTIWIGGASRQLCEAYEYDRPVVLNIAFRILDQEAQWEALQIADQVMVGIARFDGEPNSLIIENLGASKPDSSSDVRLITMNDWKDDADLDTVDALEAYFEGVIVSGTKGGQPATRYCKTSGGNCEFVSEPTNPKAIKGRVLLTNK